MNKPFIIAQICLIIIASVLCQEFNVGKELAVLEMINMEAVGKDKRGEKMEIFFIFQGQPSTYYHEINAAEHKFTLEFWDSKFGEEVPEPITIPPFTGSQIEEDSIDLNKDLEGMEPDIKKIVRVSLYFEDEIDYEITDDFNVITLTIYYGLTESGDKVKTTKGRKKPWILPTIIGSSASLAAGLVYFLVFAGEDKPPEDTIDEIGEPPNRPPN
jgi:hypothetical protein